MSLFDGWNESLARLGNLDRLYGMFLGAVHIPFWLRWRQVWLGGRRPGLGPASAITKAVAISSYSIYLTHALMLHVAREILHSAHFLPWVSYFPIALALIAMEGAGFYSA